ncbi:MAG TPA: hypothetical protein VK997_07750 [Deferrisomatales bacterium]|nr:hypothetical protein [Deferrisomatales bacterium]
MTTMLRYPWAFLAGGFFLGCSLAPVRLAGPEVYPLPPLPRTPYAIELVYTSALADPYYVMAGPAESYARYSITTQFEALLRHQLVQLSDPASDRSATLAVHLSALTTRYRRLGSSPPPTAPQGPRYAMLGTDPPAFLAAWQTGRFGDLMDREDQDADIPAEIRKGATLFATVELSGDGVPSLRQSVAAEYDDLITRWEFDPRDAYSYTDVLDQTLRVATAEITAIVQTTLK